MAKRYGYLGILLIFFTGAQNISAGTVFSLNLGNHYRIIERQDLRIRKNGQYKGFLYREYRAFMNETSASPLRYKGDYFILENMKRNSFLTAKAVDKQYDTSFTMGPQGNMLVKRKYLVPVHRNFPAFSPKPVNAGESWDVSGSDLVSDSIGNRIRVPFLCHYIFRKTGTYMNRPVVIIDAQYALRYDGDSSGEGAVIRKITGSRKASILLYTDEDGGIFIKSDIKQLIEYTNGGTEETEGFVLTWYTGASGSMKETGDTELVKTFNDLQKAGKDDKDGFNDMSLEQNDKGLVLRIQNIHFMPNSPVILASEKKRLDSIAALLKSAENRMLLVTGYTADVGTKESQQKLSVKRAKVIVDELVTRGLSPKRFMYQGRGGLDPVAANDTKEGRALNRRVEITILR